MKKFDYPIGINFAALIIVFFGAGFITGRGAWGEALAGTLISLLSSYMFFFFTVKLKDWEEKKKIKKIVDPMLEDIVTSVCVAINNSVLSPNDSYPTLTNVLKLSEQELDDLLDYEALNVPIKGFRICYPQFPIKPATYIDDLILATTLPIISKLDQIKPYYYMLDHDIVKTLTDIEKSSYLIFTGQEIKYKNSFVFNKKSFLDFFHLVRKLEDYVKVKMV